MKGLENKAAREAKVAAPPERRIANAVRVALLDARDSGDQDETVSICIDVLDEVGQEFGKIARELERQSFGGDPIALIFDGVQKRIGQMTENLRADASA